MRDPGFRPNTKRYHHELQQAQKRERYWEVFFSVTVQHGPVSKEHLINLGWREILDVGRHLQTILSTDGLFYRV